MIHLEWYVDDIGSAIAGRSVELGMLAAKCTKAEIVEEIWLKAKLHCKSRQDADRRWWGLLNTYGINAHTVFRC